MSSKSATTPEKPMPAKTATVLRIFQEFPYHLPSPASGSCSSSLTQPSFFC